MKINDKEIIGNSFAYDGCHKIYILEDEEDEREAIDYNYEIFELDRLEEIFNNSCSLKFISNWKLNKNYVQQFENAIFNNGNAIEI